MALRLAHVVGVAALALACAPPPVHDDAGVVDAGGDAGLEDAGVEDAGVEDAGIEDAGVEDAGVACPSGAVRDPVLGTAVVAPGFAVVASAPLDEEPLALAFDDRDGLLYALTRAGIVRRLGPWPGLDDRADLLAVVSAAYPTPVPVLAASDGVVLAAARDGLAGKSFLVVTSTLQQRSADLGFARGFALGAGVFVANGIGVVPLEYGFSLSVTDRLGGELDGRSLRAAPPPAAANTFAPGDVDFTADRSVVVFTFTVGASFAAATPVAYAVATSRLLALPPSLDTATPLPIDDIVVHATTFGAGAALQTPTGIARVPLTLDAAARTVRAEVAAPVLSLTDGCTTIAAVRPLRAHLLVALRVEGEPPRLVELAP